MRINNNLMAMNTHRQLGINQTEGSKSIEKLSSGLRINRAGDDAAGLAISEKMRGQIRGLNQASRNSQDGISLIQTAEGALNETQAILQRMRELAVQSSNDTNVSVDRKEIQKEVNQLTSEINRIGNTTEFNTMKLLNGDKADVIKTAKADAGTYSSPTKGLTVQDGAIGITSITIAGNAATSTPWNSAYSGTVVISKDTNGRLKVEVQAEGSAAAASNVTSVDTMDVSFTGGSYTYNNHGVSFTVTQEAFDAATTGATITFDASTNQGVTAATGANAVGTFSVVKGSTFSGEGNMTAAGLTVNANIDFNVAKVKINTIGGTGAATTGATGVTVTLMDANDNALLTDTITFATASSIDYNRHGVNFNIVSANSGSISAVFTLNVSQADQNVNRGLTFQVGANENQSMGLSLGDMRSKALGISVTQTGKSGYGTALSVSDGTSNTSSEYALDVTTAKNAAKAISTINSAIEQVSGERSKLGAVQNRLEHTIKNLDTSSENLQAAESRIRDVDMAKEMMNFSKNNILQQAAQAMLAQANQAPQGVLQLLR